MRILGESNTGLWRRLCSFLMRNLREYQQYEQNRTCHHLQNLFIKGLCQYPHCILSQYNENPMTCDHCSETFSERKKLNVHKALNHQIGELKTYKCELCEHSTIHAECQSVDRQYLLGVHLHTLCHPPLLPRQGLLQSNSRFCPLPKKATTCRGCWSLRRSITEPSPFCSTPIVVNEYDYDCLLYLD